MAVYVLDIPEDVEGMDEVLQALSTTSGDVVKLLPALLATLGDLQLVQRQYRYSESQYAALAESISLETPEQLAQFERGLCDDLAWDARARGLLLLEEPAVILPQEAPYTVRVTARAFRPPNFGG